VVERLTYQNPENGYTVARLAPERAGPDAEAARADDRLVTVVGTLAELTPGEAILPHCWWRNDPKHGWQFTVVDYRVTLPATLQGMKKYLGSGLVKGIGPVNAGRIVDTFGAATFEVIDADPRRLTEIPGIGPVRAGRIAATWAEQQHIREVMAALQGYGISTSLAVRIYKKFGDDSGRVIAQEPYRLAREVWGVGFKTADKIARAVGIAPDAPERLQAGALHVLGSAADAGHTLLPEGDLTAQASELLATDAPPVREAVAVLLETGEVVAAHQEGESPPLPALAPFARAEAGLAARLRTLASARGDTPAGRIFSGVNWAAAFGWLAKRHGLTLAPAQETGVRMALTAPVGILTGGPGTGKTHTLRAVLALARTKGLRCLLPAPTGRAAKRMEEATVVPAGTLHRVLALRPGGKAGRGPDNPLQAELVVVDEVSMLDVLLANQLARAIARGTHLLLVGDPDQLASVGAGEVLADLLRADQFPVTWLEHIFRQGAGSGIARDAKRVNAGEMPQFGDASGDCFFLPAEDPATAARLMVELVARRLPARYGFGHGDVQVLSPMHRGEAGVGALNTLLQARLNPGREGMPEARGGGRVYRPGDRVLQLKNDYNLKVFNGDLGTVRAIDPGEQELLHLSAAGPVLGPRQLALGAVSRHARPLRRDLAAGRRGAQRRRARDRDAAVPAHGVRRLPGRPLGGPRSACAAGMGRCRGKWQRDAYGRGGHGLALGDVPLVGPEAPGGAGPDPRHAGRGLGALSHRGGNPPGLNPESGAGRLLLRRLPGPISGRNRRRFAGEPA
jgi:exodeoxyribonuclease V alpha subunit